MKKLLHPPTFVRHPKGFLINTTQKELKFIAYCVEIYKQEKGLTGKEVAALFTKYNIWSYIYECYGALHTTGPQYTINDIDSIIQAGVSCVITENKN